MPSSVSPAPVLIASASPLLIARVEAAGVRFGALLTNACTLCVRPISSASTGSTGLNRSSMSSPRNPSAASAGAPLWSLSWRSSYLSVDHSPPEVVTARASSPARFRSSDRSWSEGGLRAGASRSCAARAIAWATAALPAERCSASTAPGLVGPSASGTACGSGSGSSRCSC